MFSWAQFQAALIARLASREASSTKNPDWNQYHHWLGALKDLIAGCGGFVPDDVATRDAAPAHRPTGTIMRTDRCTLAEWAKSWLGEFCILVEPAAAYGTAGGCDARSDTFRDGYCRPLAFAVKPYAGCRPGFGAKPVGRHSPDCRHGTEDQ
jgi:hypothetical protein